MLIHFLTRLTQIQNILDRSEYQDKTSKEIYEEIKKEVDEEIKIENYSEILTLIDFTPKPKSSSYMAIKERENFMMLQYFKVWSTIKQKMKREESKLNGLENIQSP